VINSLIVTQILDVLQDVNLFKTEIRKRQEIMSAFANHTDLRSDVAEKLMKWIATPKLHERFDREALCGALEVEETRKIMFSGAISQEILRSLPEQLFKRALIDNQFLKFPLRGALPPHIPIKVALLLRHQFYMPPDMIYHLGDNPRSVYLIIRGTFAHVQISGTWHISSRSTMNVEVPSHAIPGAFPYQLFGRHTYFGDSDIVNNTVHRASVRCEDVGELLSLSKPNFLQLMVDHPEFEAPWRLHALRRENRRRKLLRTLPLMPYRHLAASIIQRFFRREVNNTVVESSSFSKFAYVPSRVRRSSFDSLSLERDVKDIKNTVLELKRAFLDIASLVQTRPVAATDISRF